MKAGRELDALIADKVLGIPWMTGRAEDEEKVIRRYYAPGRADYREEIDYKNQWGTSMMTEPTDYPELPAYSTDIVDAWPIAEKLGLIVVPIDVWMYAEWDRVGGEPQPGYRWAAWQCDPGYIVLDAPQKWAGMIDELIPPDTIAETAPLAICLAAIKLKLPLFGVSSVAPGPSSL